MKAFDKPNFSPTLLLSIRTWRNFIMMCGSLSFLLFLTAFSWFEQPRLKGSPSFRLKRPPLEERGRMNLPKFNVANGQP